MHTGHQLKLQKGRVSIIKTKKPALQEEYFVLELGSKCNNNCIFCSVKNRDIVDISTQEAKNNILQAKHRGFTKIQFTGGEPTIRPDLISIIKFSKIKGFSSIGLSSNGRMFSYEKFAKSVIQSGCNYFS